MIAYITYLVQLVYAAHRASEAVRNRRAPSQDDMTILGLPAGAFNR